MTVIDKLVDLQLKMKKYYDTYQEIPDNITADYFKMLESLTKEESEQLRNKSIFI
jgi:hypothetical protein